jgi:hypothetical protein
MYAKNKNSSFFCFWLLKPYQTITTKEKHLEFFFVFLEILVDSIYAKNKKHIFFWLLKPYQTITKKGKMTQPKKNLSFFVF